MQKLKINLYGKYSPTVFLSYNIYKDYFDTIFYFEKNESFLVTGCIKDFYENADKIETLLNINPSLKLVVLSEEPFWDTVWGEGFQNKQSILEVRKIWKKIRLDYYNLNHITSNIYDFKKIPYFITTNDDYINRYKRLFERNINLSKKHYINLWRQTKNRYTFMMTRRVGKRFDVNFRFNNEEIKGLSRFRSLVCEGLNDYETYKEGKGWGSEVKRQSLTDWHLDKINKLDEKSYIVSAIENTHMNNYISEKIFDAFAVQSVPIYYASKEHRIFDLVEKGSFINLYGKDVEEAITLLERFKVDDTFMDNYMETQRRLAKLFSNKDYVKAERKRVVNEIEKEFRNINRGNIYG